MKKVVVSFTRPLEPELKKRIEEQFELLDFSHLKNPAADPDFIEAMGRAEGAIGSSLPFGSELIDKAPNLKVVSSVSVGVDNYDVQTMSQKGILLCHTPEVLTETVADTGFSLIMAAARRVTELDSWIRTGNWKKGLTSEYFGVDVHGATLGIVGMGRIGAAIAKRGHFGFNMNVIYHNRSRNADYEKKYDAGYRELDDLLKEADFICSVLPNSKQTEKLFSSREFALMGPNAIFVNVGRGTVVDEEALIKALQEGTIRAAGLDVFEKEPLSTDSPLISLKNVVLTPHIGSATSATRYDMAVLAVDNLIAGLEGKQPKAPYNWQDLHKN